MIIGVDLGNYYIKSSEGIKFESRISKNNYVLTGKAMKVVYNNTQYLIEEGNFDININKLDKEDMLISLATIIGMSAKECNIDLGIGLPVNFYKAYKDDLIKMIRDEGDFNISINGNDIKFFINKCFVIPEGVGVYYSLSNEVLNKINGELLIIDIGGKTTDMCIIDNNVTIKKPVTLPIGFLNLYNDIANVINSKYPDLCVKTEDVKYILDNGLSSFGNHIDISFVNDIRNMMVYNIINNVKLQYEDYKRKTIILCGGGFSLENEFRKYIPNIIVNKDIFANAKGFKNYVIGIGNRYA